MPSATIADDNGKEFARNHSGVERRIAGVEPQQRRAGELCRGRYHDDVVGADPADDRGAELLVAPAKHETLRADRAEHQLAVGIAVEQIEDLPFGEILADDLAVGDRIDAEQRLVD